MADGLVHLELHLLGVDHNCRDLLRARVRLEERGGLLGDAWTVLVQRQAFDVLPAGLGARTAVRARIAPDLDGSVRGRERLESGAALHELLEDIGALRRSERALLAARARSGLRDRHVGMAEGGVRSQEELDLLLERNVDRIALERRPVLARLRADRGEDDRTPRA